MPADTLTPEIRDFPVTLVVGLEQQFQRETLGDVAGLWTQLRDRADEIESAIPYADGGASFGIFSVTAPPASEITYLAATQVRDLSAVPDGMVGREIGGEQAAVFTVRLEPGPIGPQVGAAYDAIWRHWLPASDYVPAAQHDIERYDQRFDPATMTGELELIMPVKRREG